METGIRGDSRRARIAPRAGTKEDIFAMGAIERLAQGDIVVLDGETETEPEARDAPITSASSRADYSATHPGIVRSVHEDYIRAGADIITTNT